MLQQLVGVLGPLSAFPHAAKLGAALSQRLRLRLDARICLQQAVQSRPTTLEPSSRRTINERICRAAQALRKVFSPIRVRACRYHITPCARVRAC